MGIFKKKELPPIDPIREDYVGTSVELAKSLLKVNSKGIRTDITEDFVLARFGEETKEPMIEMVHLGFILKKKVKQIAVKARKWEWQENVWKERMLNEDEVDFINHKADRVFNTILYRLQTHAVLNRNLDENKLIKIIAGVRESLEGDEKTENIVTENKEAKEGKK